MTEDPHIEFMKSCYVGGFVYAKSWFYHDANGDRVGAAARYEDPKGVEDKEIRPFRIRGDIINLKGMVAPRPLYNLVALLARPDTEVLIVEGERTAEAAALLFPHHIVNTSSQGACAVNQTDWSPLKERKCFIWPDNDEAGQKYVKAVLEHVPHALVVKVPDNFPEKWDLADPAPEGADLEKILASAAPIAASASTSVGSNVVPLHPKANGSGGGLDAMRKATEQALAAAPIANGVEVLDNLLKFYRRFIIYPSEAAAVAHVLWTIHTHLMDAWDTTPRLMFMSAEKMSGKTRALEVTTLFAHSPILSIGASPAVIVRMVSDGMITIVYDEIDAVFGSAKAQEAHQDLCSVLNGGYRRGAKVYRWDAAANCAKAFDAFAPVAGGGLRTLPDTLASRSIFIRMKRRAPSEKVESFRWKKQTAEAGPVRTAVVTWCAQNIAKFDKAAPALPASIEDRSADCWEPLLAIAEAVGGQWPEATRKAATELTKAVAEESTTEGVDLLAHIREVFGEDEKRHTITILARLIDMPESPYGDIRGKPLDDRGLAKRLNPYGIKSKDVWISGITKKGYHKDQFHDAWSRYLSPPPPPEGNEGDEGDEGEEIDKQKEIPSPPSPPSARGVGGEGKRGNGVPSPAVCAHCGEPESPGRRLFTEERDEQVYEVHALCIDAWNGIVDDGLDIREFLNRKPQN
jgi:hypothetical protein